MRPTAPLGVSLGGFGWLLDVVRAPLRRERTRGGDAGPGRAPVGRVDPRSAGFIHAPSLNHATAAAILRSGALASRARRTTSSTSTSRPEGFGWRRGSSTACEQGQPLGALLGYRFERSLHEHELDRFIATFRRIAPFGELLKAQVAAEEAEAEVDRLRGCLTPSRRRPKPPRHPPGSAASSLVRKRSALPGRIACGGEGKRG
jgi:hypothetical protein